MPILRAEDGAAKCPRFGLSGAWLDRAGFVKDRGYLISVDREIDTVYLHAEYEGTKGRRRH